MNNTKIYFQEIRDFGQVFNTGFTFIRQHFKRIFMHLLSLGGPFLLVGVGVSALLMVRMQRLSFGDTVENTYSNTLPFSFAEIGLSYLINILSFLVGFVMITAVINAYIRLYKESPLENPEFSLGEVWTQVRKDFWYLTGQLFLLFLLLLVISVLMVGLGILLFDSGSSTGLKVGLGFMYFIGGFVLFCYLMPYLGGIFITQSYFERTNFFTGLARTFQLIKNNWWLTFGLGVVNVIIMYVVFFICYLPLYFLMMISMFASIDKSSSTNTSSMTGVLVGSVVLLTLGYLVTFIIHYVMAAVHYHNLLERKEGGGLLAKIQTIGTQPSATAAVDFYDEEEKY